MKGSAAYTAVTRSPSSSRRQTPRRASPKATTDAPAPASPPSPTDVAYTQAASMVIPENPQQKGAAIAPDHPAKLKRKGTSKLSTKDMSQRGMDASASTLALPETMLDIAVPTGARLQSVVSPERTSIPIRLDSREQHTISWSLACRSDVPEQQQLPVGRCNLYRYPLCTLGDAMDGVEEAVEGEQLACLREIVLGLCSATKGDSSSRSAIDDPLCVRDPVGATAIHGLLIANNDASVTLALDLLERRPELLPVAHGVGGPFEGENALHVLAVNRRQSDVMRLLAMAEEHLDDDALRSLLTSMAEGPFFRSEPMRSYGGSPIAYMVSFRITAALDHVLTTPRYAGLVDVNSSPCPISGYYPVHAAVANGRVDMFDFVTARGADPTLATVPKRGTPFELTALQLACRLGQQVMAEHIIESRRQVQWRWGPVTSYKLPLEEIDSAGPSLHDVLELIVLPDASKATQEMILDNFMGGLLFQLFKEKWDRFGAQQHLFFRLLDAVALALLVTVGFSLKLVPLQADRAYLPVITIAATALQVWYELMKVACGRKRDTRLLDGRTILKFATHASAVLACLSVLMTAHEPSEDGAGDELSWALLSISVFFQFNFFISVIFVPYQQISVLALVVERLILNDVKVFLIFYFLYLGCFWSSMFINYPRAGIGTLDLVPQFNSLTSSFESMINLGIAGIHFEVDFSTPAVLALNHGQLANLLLFTLFYYFCMLLLVILLLRLLMAMLSATFAAMRQEATLEWRISFARHVLQHELTAMRAGKPTHAGERVGDEWVHIFRTYVDAVADDESTKAKVKTRLEARPEAPKVAKSGSKLIAAADPDD